MKGYSLLTSFIALEDIMHTLNIMSYNNNLPAKICSVMYKCLGSNQQLSVWIQDRFH